MKIPMNNKPLLTRKQAAGYLNVSPKTLEKWACNGTEDLPYYKLGRNQVRYRPEDLEVWLEKRVKRPADLD